jgi:hypothetical protein
MQCQLSSHTKAHVVLAQHHNLPLRRLRLVQPFGNFPGLDVATLGDGVFLR